MFEGTPWILIVLVVILALTVILGIFLTRTMKASGKSIFSVLDKKTFLCQFSIGLLCSLTGAFLMFNGEIFGDNTTGIARILGIIGICLIVSTAPIGIAVKKKL
ncbi:hypothetical protein ACFLYQ_05115 [Chloroflexota bacterium]